MVCWQAGVQDIIFLLFMILLSVHPGNLFSACGCTGTISETKHMVLSCNIPYSQKKKKSECFYKNNQSCGFFINCRSLIKHFHQPALNNSAFLGAYKENLVVKENFVLLSLLWLFQEVMLELIANYGEITKLLEDNISWQDVLTNHNAVKKSKLLI